MTPLPPRAVLEPIHEDMHVIESMPYHQLCLLYKGESETGTVMGSNITAAGGDSARYGIANWHYYSGRRDEASQNQQAQAAENHRLAANLIG